MLQIIFDSVEPYAYEAAPLLFLPKGMTYRARYKWDNVKPLDEDTIRGQLSRTAVVSFRYLPSSQHYVKTASPQVDDWLSSPRVIPLRLVTLLDVTSYGPFFVIQFRVEDFPDFSVNPDRDYFLSLLEYSNALNFKGAPQVNTDFGHTEQIDPTKVALFCIGVGSIREPRRGNDAG